MRRHRRWLYGFLWIVILAFVILYVPALTDRGQGTPAETLVDVGGLRSRSVSTSAPTTGRSSTTRSSTRAASTRT
jgi:hypothetical protein